MKFITSRNIKFVAILLIFLSLISLSLSTETKKFEGKMDPKCVMRQEMRIQEEQREDGTRKLLFFVLLGYFYSVYL